MKTALLRSSVHQSVDPTVPAFGEVAVSMAAAAVAPAASCPFEPQHYRPKVCKLCFCNLAQHAAAPVHVAPPAAPAASSSVPPAPLNLKRHSAPVAAGSMAQAAVRMVAVAVATVPEEATATLRDETAISAEQSHDDPSAAVAPQHTPPLANDGIRSS